MRRITGIRRIGHAGTLDPLASGVLIVLVGRAATKRQAEFMNHPKQYVAEITLGQTSVTYDAEGPFTTTASAEQLAAITQQDIENCLPPFIGTIQQQPPIYSAIKKNGKALYKQARAGSIKQEDIPSREVTIDNIALLDYNPPRIRIQVDCQKGVYIRSLANDIGEALGVGGYLSALERTAIGEYTIEKAITLEAYEDLYKNRR